MLLGFGRSRDEVRNGCKGNSEESAGRLRPAGAEEIPSLKAAWGAGVRAGSETADLAGLTPPPRASCVARLSSSSAADAPGYGFALTSSLGGRSLGPGNLEVNAIPGTRDSVGKASLFLNPIGVPKKDPTIEPSVGLKRYHAELNRPPDAKFGAEVGIEDIVYMASDAIFPINVGKDFMQSLTEPLKDGAKIPLRQAVWCMAQAKDIGRWKSKFVKLRAHRASVDN